LEAGKVAVEMEGNEKQTPVEKLRNVVLFVFLYSTSFAFLASEMAAVQLSPSRSTLACLNEANKQKKKTAKR